MVAVSGEASGEVEADVDEAEASGEAEAREEGDGPVGAVVAAAPGSPPDMAGRSCGEGWPLHPEATRTSPKPMARALVNTPQHPQRTEPTRRNTLSEPSSACSSKHPPERARHQISYGGRPPSAMSSNTSCMARSPPGLTWGAQPS